MSTVSKARPPAPLPPPPPIVDEDLPDLVPVETKYIYPTKRQHEELIKLMIDYVKAHPEQAEVRVTPWTRCGRRRELLHQKKVGTKTS